MPYDYKTFPYRRAKGLDAPEPRHSCVIVGAGPIGLALALDLAGRGQRVTVLDDNDVVSVGSRAICWSKRSLEILDRLGVGERCVAKGVTWKVGRTFHRDREIFSFDLQPEAGHKMPAFVNLQQYYVEEYLAEAALGSPLVDLRFKNRVDVIAVEDDHVRIGVETPEGDYTLDTSYLVACDGSRSPVRQMLGLDFAGELFEEHFLIADIEMEADFPSERRFWFEPTFHPGQSALLHKQPDNIYRIDLQLGWEADPGEEKKPEKVTPRIEKVVGHRDFRLDWVSVYTFQCRRLERFVHGPVIFAGDSAHVVSPFGARGGNSGLEDVAALGWRLAAVLEGRSEPGLLGAYDRERAFGADENLLNSSRSTRFMTPAPGAERLFRDAVLALASEADFARPMANSGRLSRPCIYPLEATDDPRLPTASRPGAVAPDAPQGKRWLGEELGTGVTLMAVGSEPPKTGLRTLQPEVNEALAARYLGDATQALYLIRPDQVVAARWVEATAEQIETAEAALWEEPR
jgi:3-(3-hydroxy-phenyl)propionate hydroxylase